MNNDYDVELENLEWFQRHPQLLPFIGDDYNTYRILQIGESHFIDKKIDENNKFNINYFQNNWWTTSCNELVESFNDGKHSCCWFDKRKVLQNYLDDNDGSYGIFINAVKSFSKVIKDKEITHINKEDKKLYNNFAFMNFFQMPSLYNGLKYWNSLKKSALPLCNDDKKIAKQLASNIFRKCVEISIKTVDDVIEIINPKIIIFTSVSAGNAYAGREYKDCVGKYKDKYKRENDVIYTCHPSTVYWENKNLRKSGKIGKEILEDKLKLLKECFDNK